MAGAQVAISALPASTTILSTDILPFLRGGVTDKITGANFRTQLFAFASNDPLNCGVLTAVGNSTVTGTLTGLTGLTTSGGATVSSGGIAVTGNSTITGTLTSLTGITSSGTAAFAAVTASGSLTFSSAVSKIIPGATSLQLRNNGDTQNNVLIADNGDTTIRGQMSVTGTFFSNGTLLIAGTGFATAGLSKSATVGLQIGGTTGSINDMQLYSGAGLGALAIPTGTTNIQVISGALTFGAASSKIIPGSTQLSHRNNADSADNLLISDAGVVTVRAGLTVTSGGLTVTAGGITASAGNITATTGNVAITAGNLSFGSATPGIISGATSLAIRNAANSQDNLVVSNGGTVTAPSGGFLCAASTTAFATLTVAHGVAPTSPVNGDFWTTTAGAFIRINGVTKTFTLT